MTFKATYTDEIAGYQRGGCTQLPRLEGGSGRYGKQTSRGYVAQSGTEKGIADYAQ